MTLQPLSSDKSPFRLLSTFTTAGLSAALAVTGGCQIPNAGSSKNVDAGILAPASVQQYAQQRRINNEQARHELQQKVSQHDEEQAIENIDAVGVKQP